MLDAVYRCIDCLRTGAPCELGSAEWALLLAVSAVAGYWLLKGLRRVVAGAVTLRATALTPRLSRVLSHWVGSVEYSFEDFLRADGAGSRWVELRRAAIERLSETLHKRYARSSEWGDRVRGGFSDLRFTDANRVPFPFARLVRERFNLCSVVTASRGPWLLDLDQNWTLDVSGSYGVNVAGFDRYKEWMRKGLERVQDVGPVLGPLHPVLAENVAILKRISGLDEVSFHMSGTEAVMAAVRMVRHNTRRKYIVCFSGAYHGWWDGVQPGLGSERELGDCLALVDLDPASLDVIRWRAREIAGVLVNPVQCFHPNAPPPNDAVLLTSEVRKTEETTTRYTAWLRRLREVCSGAGVPLIFDEVYTGFRLAPGGAQEYFDVKADVVVYGKTVAGGFPVGLVCGKSELMRRFDPEHPMRIAYVVGTFSAHPAVMGAMREFLDWVTEPQVADLYRRANRQCSEWALATNQRLAEARLPIRVVNLATVWTVLFKEPSRFNWLLQYYLRAEGVTLSWVGTGRCLASLDFESKDYEQLQNKIVSAAVQMKRDGWWVSEQEEPGRDKKMRVRLIKEMVSSLVPVPASVKAFYAEVMLRKEDDHHASHNNRVNQYLHLLSSSVFLFCYFASLSSITLGMWLGLPALFLRQMGHALFEPDPHEKEQTLLGFTTPSKTTVVACYLLIPLAHLFVKGSFGWAALTASAPGIAWHWFLFTNAVVFGHVVYLCWTHGLRSSMVWFVKLITDPLTDVVQYYSPARLLRA